VSFVVALELRKAKSVHKGHKGHTKVTKIGAHFCIFSFSRHNSCIPARRAKPTQHVPLLIGEDGRTDGRLGQIVRLLADHPMVVVSGTKLAEEIGGTRSAVWRVMEQLRSLGVEIAGHPRTGYRLERVPDLLLPEVLDPLLGGTRFAGKLHHYFRVDSTNTAALAAAAAAAPTGSVFLAEEQTAGRGRSGHAWQSERSVGIYCSVLLRPQLAPADALLLSLLTGLATAEAIADVCERRPDLRWPNDLLFGGSKVGGVLIELAAEATRLRHVVIGIGLNVNQLGFSGELAKLATSLRLETGRPLSRVVLTAALLKQLDTELAKLERSPAAARSELIQRFEAAPSMARGKRVHVEEDGGYEGMTEGLDERGFLRVRTRDGVRTVLSGGVREIA
jgi:BirA family biotin operon repressor/biotin-[acetyl-CoA-carboxylase] ligase